MQANPISFGEIEAFSILLGEELQPWEVRALRSLDAAILSGAKKSSGSRKKGDAVEPDVVVSAKDGVGVSALMKGLGAKPAKKKAG